MLHRIEVDVIDVTLEVSVVADGMLPKRHCQMTINLPQAFDMFDKKPARPVSQNNCEKENPAFDVSAPIS